jgi:hypothetical protein
VSFSIEVEVAQVDVPYRQLKQAFYYINRLFGMRCFVDLLQAGIYPDAKEITESAAAFRAVWARGLGLFDPSDPSVVMIAVGDGASPRTAAMFAFRTAWTCYSVDPNLKDKKWPVLRVHCHRKKVEDMRPLHVKKMVIAAVHSHAPLDIVEQKFTADQRTIVAIPCCVRQELEREPDLEYVDKGIWSPQNTVKVWHFPKKE